MGRVGKIILGVGLFVGTLIAAPYLTPLLAALPGGTMLAGFLVNTALALSMGLAASALASPQDRSQEFEQNTADPFDGLPVVYGSTYSRLGLKIVDVQTAGTDNRDLYLVGAVCHGNGDGTAVTLGDIYIDGEKVFLENGSYVDSGKMSKHVTLLTKFGGDTTGVVPHTALTTNFPSNWPSTSRARGVAYVALKLHLDDEEPYWGGVPQVVVSVQGCKVLDPRTGTYAASGSAASQNPICCLYDYLTSTVYGLGQDTTLLDTASFVTAANHCETSVTVPGAGGVGTVSEPRYTIRGPLSTTASPLENIALLLQSCSGRLYYSGGKYGVIIPTGSESVALALTEDDCLTDLSIGVLGTEAINRVRYSYLDYSDTANYGPRTQTLSWPRPGDSNPYITADNNWVSEGSASYPLVTSPYQAERLAAMSLKESQSGMSAMFGARLKALQLRPMDVITLTHSTPGWSAKKFWVSDVTFTRNGLVRLLLAEYDANAYTTGTQTYIESPPNTNIPNSGLIPSVPGSLVLSATTSDSIIDQDGSYFRRIKVTWTPATGAQISHYIISVYGLDAAASPAEMTVRHDSTASSYTAYLGPVSDGASYSVLVRAVSLTGHNGPAAYDTVTVGNPTEGAPWGWSTENLIRNGDEQLGVQGQTPQQYTNATGTLKTSRATGGVGNVFEYTHLSASASDGFLPDFSMVSGRYYRVSIRIRMDNATGDTGTGAYLRLRRMSGTLPVVRDKSPQATLTASDTADNLYLGVDKAATGSGFIELYAVLAATAACTLRPYLCFGKPTTDGSLAGIVAGTALGGGALVAVSSSASLTGVTYPAGQGPNAPAGVAAIWPGYDGSIKPYQNGSSSITTLNSFGSGAAGDQMRMVSIVTDGGNPTGTGTALDLKFPAWNDQDWPLAFPPDSWGGQSPSRWGYQMGLEGQNWRTLYLRFNAKWSSAFGEFGRLPSQSVDVTGITVTGTTQNVVTCSGVSWTTNQWVGKYVRRVNAQSVFRITANTANTLTITPDFPYVFGTDFSPCEIVTFSTGAQDNANTNAGTKWFFPRIVANASGSGTVHGQAWSRSLTNVGCEANFINGVHSANFQFGGTQFIDPCYNLQIHDWDGAGTDGQGAIGTNGNISYGIKDVFGYYPGHIDYSISKGAHHDFEFLLTLPSSPGASDGVFKCWVDNVLLHNTSTVPMLPSYVTDTVLVNGVYYTVPVPITSARWGYVWHDSTFGGGYRIPEQEHHLTLRSWWIGGKA